MIKRLVQIIVAIILLFIIGGCTVSVSSGGEGNLPLPQAETGDTITIADCKADPSILQVNDGTEVTFVNSDSQDHTIFIEQQEINLPAQGSAKFTARSPTGTQYTTNYNCDQQYGGAIFIV